MPKLIATQVLELAYRLDSGENFDLDTKSNAAENDAIAFGASRTRLIVPSKLNFCEIITKSKLPDQETGYDFVIDSKPEGRK